MNTTEKITAGLVLCVALGVVVLGHVVAGFVLAVCVALWLGSRINTSQLPTPQPFVLPDEGWAITREERKVPVLYCACARDNVMRFMAGQSQEVELKQDNTAQSGQDVTVYGRWTDRSGCQQHRKLGHIPAKEIIGLYSETQKRPECLVSAKLSEVFVPTRQDAFPGLALDIAVLEPAHDRKKARRRTG